MSQKEHSRVFIRGGVFGTLELLRALSNWRQLYLQAWMLPPLLTRGSPQVREGGLMVEYLTGVAGETALHWSSPRMSLTQAKDRDRAYSQGKQQGKEREQSVPTCAGDADLWSVEPEGRIYLEVAIKVTKNRRQSLDIARDVFAEEVVHTIHGLTVHSRWIALEVSAESCIDNVQSEGSSGHRDPMERLTVYPQAKGSTGQTVEAGMPLWASQAFMTSLRARGEAVAEFAVLVGQEVDDGSYGAIGGQSHFETKFVGAMSAEQSADIARQLETETPTESIPSLFPSLLENFKDICGVAQQSHKSASVVEKLGTEGDPPAAAAAPADKWWGGGEGWRGTEEGVAHDLDPSAREAHRTSVFSSSAQRIQAAIGLRDGIPRVYIPCQVRFSLLCFCAADTAETADEHAADSGTEQNHHTEERGVQGGSSQAPATSKLSKVRSMFKKAAKKVTLISNMASSAPEGLMLGTGKVISRLIASTVWLSADAAIAVWSCIPLNKTISVNRHSQLVKSVIAMEAELKWQEAHKMCLQCSPNYIRAYGYAGLSVALTSRPDAMMEYFPDSVRMMESMAVRARRLEELLRMLRQLLDRPRSGAGDCLALVHLDGLAATLVFHVSLSVRLLTTSPQCIHYAGGGYVILSLIYQIEKSLQLGSYSLSAGMRSGYVLRDPAGGPWRLPMPTLDPDTLREMYERKVGVDGTSGIRRAIAAGGESIDQLVDILLQLESMVGLLSNAMADAVHKGCRKSMGTYISLAVQEDSTAQHTDQVETLARRLDKRANPPAAKRVMFAEPQDSAAAEPATSTDIEQENERRFEADSAAFLDAIKESMVLPSEKIRLQPEPHAEDETDGTPTVLLGRTRHRKPARTYGPDSDAITMLDNLRAMYS